MTRIDMEALKENSAALKARGVLKDFAASNLDQKGKYFICPNCKSGTHKNGTPAFSIDPKGERWKCFACEKGGDVYDLAGIIFNTDDFLEQYDQVAYFAHDKTVDQFTTNGTWDYKPGWKVDGEPAEEPKKEEPAPNFTEGQVSHKRYIEDSRRRLESSPEAMEYLHSRGFTDDEIRRFSFGYDAEAGGAKDEHGNWCKPGRIVIPWKHQAGYYHVDRSVDPTAKERKYTKPKAEEVGAQPVGWSRALEGDTCFVVEGLLDAYAVEAMGYHAVPLAGTGYDKVLNSISNNGYDGVLVLMLDDDEPGKNAQAKAADMCATLKLVYIEDSFTAHNIEVKDACEALELYRDEATAALKAMHDNAMLYAETVKEQQQREAWEALNMQDPATIAGDIFNCVGIEQPISTGFPSLDNVTNGGLRSGLIVTGATSSAGKTTLIVQVADQIAAQGRPVLFCTIEQSGREIVAKSLSRMMAQRGFKSVGLWEMADTKWRNRWPMDKNQVLFDAMSDYMEQVAPNLVIMSAKEQPTVKQVEAAAYAIAHERGASPVVFIDYLQLLAAPNEHSTDKQAADYNVSQLRRMARDLKTPVWVISSLNRTSYSGVIEMESFKESGGIEYGSDLLIGLQPYNMKEKMREGKSKSKDSMEARAKDLVNEYRTKAVRECELCILKNRNGYVPAHTLPFTYDAASSLFTEGV